MTIGVDMGDDRSRQVEANLYKLLDVTLVERISDAAAITHELALIKIRIGRDWNASLPQELVEQFHARVLAQGPESLVLEATGTPDQIDVLVEILRPCVILEMVRTGRAAMSVPSVATPHGTDVRRLAVGPNSYNQFKEGAD
jgi:acetolactate synthase I/III small subunit